MRLNTKRNPMIYVLAWIAGLVVNIIQMVVMLPSYSGNVSGQVVSGAFTVICIVIGIAVVVYQFWFFWNVCADINTICKNKEKDASQMSPNWLVVCLLSIVTLGIYQLYWVYKQCNRLQFCSEAYNRKIKESGSVMLLFYILGYITLGITTLVAIYKLTLNLNTLSEAYNEEAEKDGAVESKEMKSESIPNNGSEGGIIGIRGAYSGAEVKVRSGEEVMIGRDRHSANIIIDDERVSRRHCGIRFLPDRKQYQVMDYSRNGVYYANGQQLPKNTMTVCYPGSILRIGKTDNEFKLI